jgi:hypothetical protein
MRGEKRGEQDGDRGGIECVRRDRIAPRGLELAGHEERHANGGSDEDADRRLQPAMFD